MCAENSRNSTVVVPDTRHASGTSACWARNTYHRRTHGAAAVSSYLMAHTSCLTTNRRDRIVTATTTRALPLSSQSQLRIRRTQAHTTRTCRGRGQPLSATCCCWYSRSTWARGSPPCLKRTRRSFPRPAYKASSACALICSGAANPWMYVRIRAIAVVEYFSPELCWKKSCIMFWFSL